MTRPSIVPVGSCGQAGDKTAHNKTKSCNVLFTLSSPPRIVGKNFGNFESNNRKVLLDLNPLALYISRGGEQ
jgi:hypothetical protein